MEEIRNHLIASLEAFGRVLAGTLADEFDGRSPHVPDQVAMLRRVWDLKEELRTGKAYQQ